MKTILQAVAVYKELIHTGGIHCTAEGENIFLEIKGNLAGDLLVFIGAKNKHVPALSEIHDLIQSDSTLQTQRDLAFKALRQKYAGLTLLPVSLVWSINIIISAIYSYLNFNRIHELFCGEFNKAEIIALLPIAGITVITYLLIKIYGLKILKPLVFLVIKVFRFYQKVRNRKIA